MHIFAKFARGNISNESMLKLMLIGFSDAKPYPKSAAATCKTFMMGGT